MLQKTYSIELFLWQETPIVKLDDFHIEAAANLVTSKYHYGVVNASFVLAKKSYTYLSLYKEFFFTTHKSILFSRYRLKNGDHLLVANIHAINFREENAFAKELKRIFLYLEKFNGPLIVAGDFNTWNKSRLLRLYTTMRKLRLRHVPFDQTTGIKSFRSNPLDHIFYRNLNLSFFNVVKNHALSDHQPLIAVFEVHR